MHQQTLINYVCIICGRQNSDPQDDHVMEFGIQMFYVT